jgi:hypothetical protein
VDRKSDLRLVWESWSIPWFDIEASQVEVEAMEVVGGSLDVFGEI